MTKGKTEPKFPKYDRYCGRILQSLIVIGKKIRFNNFHELLGANGLEIAKPTLNKHLKHLVKENLVVRTVEDVQNVTYEVNHKFFRDLEKDVKLAIKSRKRLAEEEQIFKSRSMDDQINTVFENMMLRNLDQLKTNIELELNPSKKWDKSLKLRWLQSDFFYRHEKWLVTKIRNDREYGEKILRKLDRFIEKLKKDLKSGSS